MRGTRMFGLAMATSLLGLAAGCGGSETAAPVQTVDLSGLIEVDKLNEKLPVDKEQLEGAIAETLQERAPEGVRVVYNPGAPPVQRFSQSGGGNQGSGKQKSPPPPPATGTPPPPPGDGTPPPAKQGEGCERQMLEGTTNGTYITYVCPTGVAPPADNGTYIKQLTVGDPAPTRPPDKDGSYEKCVYVTSSGVAGKGYVQCNIVGSNSGNAGDVGFPCSPAEAANCAGIQLNPLCKMRPEVCLGGYPKPTTLNPFLRGVIGDSFEKAGVQVEPGSATAAVSLAEISIAGVKANVEASETGEIVSEVEEAAVPTSVSEEDGGDAEGAGEPVVEGDPEEPIEGEVPADGTLPEEGTEVPDDELPAAPSDAAPAPEPDPAPAAPAP